jgi:hypothetical protein
VSLRPSLLILSAAALILAACDRPKGAPRVDEAPVAAPAPVEATPPPAPLPQRPSEPIVWDEASGRFTLDGMVLKTAHLWRFDGALEAFSSAGSKLAPAPAGGLQVTEEAPDAVIRSPQNLGIEGKRYNAVLVRLTRVRPSDKWDGSIFYTTAAHGEAGAFHTKPLRGANPVQGETTIMVYDMASLKKGGDDWTASTISGLRLDFDDSPGGAFLVHEIAVVSLPAAAILRPPQ